MGLEAGEFLGDLVQTNPVTATDPVSEGSDHLRLLKKVLQQTFPNYDEAVTLSPAELNDAALKSVPQSISGLWTLDNNVAFQGRNFADTLSVPLIKINNVNESEFGNATLRTRLQYFEEMFISRSGVPVAQFTAAVSGALLVSDAAGSLSPVAKVGAQEIIIALWQFDAGLLLANDVAVQGLNSLDIARDIVQIEGDEVVLGDRSAGTTRVRANTTIAFELADVEYAQVVNRNSGSLLVADRTGTLKKAGFRNPSRIVLSGDKTLTQDDEGTIQRVNADNLIITIPQLEALTNVRLTTAAFFGTVLAEDAGVNIRWLDGSGLAKDGPRNIAAASIVELVWDTATTVYIFGNGIS